MADLPGVPSAPAPHFTPGLRIVARQAIAASDQDFLAAMIFERNWGRVSLMRFGYGVTRTDLAPERFSCCGIQRQQKRLDRAVGAAPTVHRFVPLQNLEVKPALVEHRRGREGPLKGKVAIIFCNAARPELFARMIKGHKCAISVKEEYSLAIGYRRRRREIAHVVALNPLAHVLVPKDLARFAIQAQSMEALGSGLRRGDKHMITPDDRCRRAGPRQVGPPQCISL